MTSEIRGSKSTTDNTAGQMGDFHIIDAATSGTNYRAAGIFAAHAFGGGASFGQDIFFFGDNAGFFVMEGVDISDSGFKLNVGTEKIEDTITTPGASTKFSPNTVFSPATDTLGTRTTREMSGYTGGLIEEFSSSGLPIASGTTLFWTLGTLNMSNSDPVPGNVDVDTNATTNKVHVHLNGENPEGTPGSLLFFAALGDEPGNTTSGESAFFDDQTFGAIDTPGALQTIKGVTAGNVEHGMATVNADSASDFGVSSPCTCSFLNWGVWSASFDQLSGSLVIQNDRIHLAGWVSGDLSDLTGGLLANQPTGSATYTGHMYGSVQTVISSVTHMYQASGTYTNVWNFDTDTGSVTLGNFDGLANITGTATALTNQREFAAFSMTNGTHNAQVRGSFVKSSTDNVAGQMGDFHILGTDYKAAGIANFANGRLPHTRNGLQGSRYLRSTEAGSVDAFEICREKARVTGLFRLLRLLR